MSEHLADNVIATLIETFNRNNLTIDHLPFLREFALTCIAAGQKQGWQDGLNDAIEIVKKRKIYYDLHREGEAMKTKPVVFAIIDELLVMLEAQLQRGQGVAQTSDMHD